MNARISVALAAMFILLTTTGCENGFRFWRRWTGPKAEAPRSTDPAMVMKETPSREFETYHVVQKGDTLSKIARQYGSTPWRIATDNGLGNGNLIHPGQRLAISRATPDDKRTPPLVTESRATAASTTASSAPIK